MPNENFYDKILKKSAEEQNLMKALGIVSEYNPFHNGHRFQIKNAKEQSGADVAIAVMSGNYVQRGDVAVYSKH